MVETFKKLCQTFGAGALGGLVASMVFLMVYEAGVTDALSVSYRPGHYLTIGNGGFNDRLVWLYEAMSLGGVFALSLNLPWIKGSQLQKAGIVMMIPTAFQLLYVFPMQGFKLFGIGFGSFTFVFVLLFSFVWALITVSFAPEGG